MASGDEIVEERPSVAGTTPTESQDTNVDADSSALPEKAEIVTMQTATVMIEEPKQVVQRLRADMGQALCVCILGSRVFQGRDSEELVKAVAKEFGRSLGEQAAFVTGGMPGVQKTFALNCGDGLRMWNLVSNTGSSGFGVGEDVQVGRDPAEHREVLGLLGDLYFTIEGGPATAQEARAAHDRGATVIPVTRSGGASSGLFDFPSAAMKRPPCATEEHWAALQSPEAPLEAVAQAATAIALALAGALERPQPEAHEAAAASPADLIPDNAEQADLQVDVAAPAQATPPEEAADGPAEPTPAGLELSQPPMPLSAGLGDDDVEQLDVEPVPSRGRANVSAEPEEASLGSSKRPTGQSHGKSPTKATSSPKSGTGTGEAEAASRARDLISRELLDELSQADDWNEGRVAPTPPIPGFETPSETRTPSPGHTPRKPQYNEGLMCLDQWDWKTDAPEFVPGSMKGLLDGAAWAMPRGGGGQDAGPEHLRAQFEWQLKTKSTELRDMQNRMNQLEIETAQVRASWEMERRNLVRQIGHYRAVLERYCIPLDEAAGASYGTEDVSSYCTGFEPSAPSQWGGPSLSNGAVCTGGGQQSQQSQAAYSSNSAAVASTAACGGGAAEAQQAPSTLDSKMRQLNHLLQEDSAQSRRKTTPEKHTNDVEKESMAAGEANGGFSSGSIASTLRAMFPHATVRTGRNDKADGAGEKDDAAEARKVEQHLKRLERSTSGTVDDRALRSFHALSAREAREALQKVEDLVQAQGGHCRNLSSILQSVCRKIEKRSGRPGTARQCPEEDTPRAGWCGNGAAATATREAAQATRAAEAAAAAAVYSGATGGDTSRSRRVRQADEDGDAFDDSSESAREGRVTKESTHDSSGFAGGPIVRTVSMQSQGSNVLDTPAGKRSWADIQSGDEDDPPREEPLDSTAQKSGGDRGVEASEDHSEDPEYWISQRIEKAARRGFDLRRRGDHWDLKISMGGLDPPLTEAGMEKYCRWLMVRFSTFREEHGAEPLRRCRGEVDFSHNRMNNQMVWMLLETLAQYEVHTALLKLFANHISQGGVLAICEFIRKNDKAEALQELHLSHNEIDDESALELLRVLHCHRPRYPPRRTCEGTGEYMLAPVWLRLNHNRIRDPDSVRRIAEAEGITVCGAKDRQACGTSRCNRRECPLVHLYSFNVQARRRPPETQWQPSAGQQPPSESEENPGITGDQRGIRRKRNRKPGAKDFKKELDDSVEVDVARG